MHILLHLFWWTYTLISFGYIPRSGIVWSYGNFLFCFWDTTKLFSIEVVPFYILISKVQGSQFLHILANPSYFLLLLGWWYHFHPSECETVSHCGFDLHFLNAWWSWTYFHMLISHLYIFFFNIVLAIWDPSNFHVNLRTSAKKAIDILIGIARTLQSGKYWHLNNISPPIYLSIYLHALSLLWAMFCSFRSTSLTSSGLNLFLSISFFLMLV